VARSVSVPTITCPYCRFTFVNVKVTKHGLINCGNCGKTMKI
jgi:transcription elongation factor Elf1